MVSIDAATISFAGFGYRRDCSSRPMGPISHVGCTAATMRLRLGSMAPFRPIEDWKSWLPEIRRRWPAKIALLAWKRKGIWAFGPGFEFIPLCRPFGGPEPKLAQKLSTSSHMTFSRSDQGEASPATKGKDVA